MLTIGAPSLDASCERARRPADVTFKRLADRAAGITGTPGRRVGAADWIRGERSRGDLEGGCVVEEVL